GRCRLATCGWAGCEFVELLEERLLDGKIAKAESNLGPIEEWSYEVLEVRRKVPQNVTGIAEAVRRILETGPLSFASAVSSIQVEGGEIVVRFRTADDLRPKLVEGRTVECLLY